MIILNLLRGGKGAKSIIDLNNCSTGDWIIQGIYLFSCCLMTFYTKKIIQNETYLKSLCSTHKGEVEFTGKKLG